MPPTNAQGTNSYAVVRKPCRNCHRQPSSPVASAVMCAAADYKVSLGSVPEGDKEGREQQLHACHQRGADKLLRLCFDNGGIYIKLGQHIGQLVSSTHALECSKHRSVACTGV